MWMALGIVVCALAEGAAVEQFDSVSLLQVQQVTSARQLRHGAGSENPSAGGGSFHARSMPIHGEQHSRSLNDSLHLSQASARHQDENWRCAPIQKNFDGIYQVSGICGNGLSPSTTERDTQMWYPGSPAEDLLDIPLLKLREEHGEQDLFEVFGHLNDWINNNSWWDPSYNNYSGMAETLVFSEGDEYPDPIDMTFKWDGHEIHSRQDHRCMTADDAYCFANGWLKNQNPELNPVTLNDFDAYHKLTSKLCREKNEKYSFDNEYITMRTHLMETNRMYELTDNACNIMDTNGPLPTDRDYEKHGYVKCLMNYAHMEVSYCYFRGCLLENNRIGHGNECDY